MSFEIYNNPAASSCPSRNLEGAAAQKQAKHRPGYFWYDLYKLTTRSGYKMTPVNSNEHTQTLKLFVKDKENLKRIKSKIKYILSQGLDKAALSLGNGESFTQLGEDEITEQNQMAATESIHGDARPEDDDLYDQLGSSFNL